MATLSKDEAKKERARKGQRKAMAKRDCPNCGRGNALKQFQSEDGGGKTCRYCGYERFTAVTGETTEYRP